MSGSLDDSGRLSGAGEPDDSEMIEQAIAEAERERVRAQIAAEAEAAAAQSAFGEVEPEELPEKRLRFAVDVSTEAQLREVPRPLDEVTSYFTGGVFGVPNQYSYSIIFLLHPTE